MKRSALIILTVIYLLSCVGMSVTRLYCCGKLTSVSFSYGAADNAVGKTSSNKKCCGHEKQSFKVKDNHFNSASLALNHPLPAIIPSFVRLNDESAPNLLNAHINYRGNAPPGHPDIPAYTLYCTYRI
ncbi:hypothetical protein [Mucilaginibacter sp. BT774]|uniref:HYC_CC_PP family protein n=1 Tax=Mucilaginibacter sp. BT774 TaxID=3062276 RepID=UPI00267470EE|nr:hypothetical protein [Mucilaginibacter sp. BT774]MDO3628027.1 hypothetical protein [Mucilaginibacter sp. BT774]